nr:hypothetical protein [Streptomyces sp. e14]
MEDAIKVYLDAGVNPRKLTVGFPFYGRGWQGVADGGAAGEWAGRERRGARPVRHRGRGARLQQP